MSEEKVTKGDKLQDACYAVNRKTNDERSATTSLSVSEIEDEQR